MSYTEVYAVRPNGDVELYGEAQNAWGGAMHIWVKLAKKYGYQLGMEMDMFQALWKGIADMEERDQWVIASTFDRAMVAKEWLSTLLEHLRAFEAEYPSKTLREEISILERALRASTIRAICFNQTSVSESPWTVYDQGPDAGERPSYNVDRDTGHWWLTPRTLVEPEGAVSSEH